MERAQQVKVLAAKHMTFASKALQLEFYLGPTWWKERTESFSDLHVCAVAHTHE